MVKITFSMIQLPLVILLNNLVSGESDGGRGLEIPPDNPHPPREKHPGRNWESWMSPEGTLWYPGRRDYRMREKGDGAGAAPSKSDTHDTSTRRYFSLEEGPQYLSEHRVANSAHSQYGQGGVKGGVVNPNYGQYGQGGVEAGVGRQGGVEAGVGRQGGVEAGVGGQGGVEAGVRGQGGERGWYPYEGRYGPGEENQFPGTNNGQYPVDRRDQYGSYGNGKYAGNVPYGEFFLNGERVPDAGDPSNGDYTPPDHMRGHYVPEPAGGQYVPEENGQLLPGQGGRYIPGNGNQGELGPEYGAVPDPNGDKNGHFLPDDYYPEGDYAYEYYDSEDFGPIGVEGGEHGVYIPPAHQYDPNLLYENGQQPEGTVDSHIPAGQGGEQSPDEAGHTAPRTNTDSNHMIYAGRDFLPVPTAQNNHSSDHRGLPESQPRYETEGREDLPNLIDRDTRIDSSRPALNRSSSEGRAPISVHRRIPEISTTARPTTRHPVTATEPPTTTTTTTTTTTEPPTTTTTRRPTTASTRATTKRTIATSTTRTTHPTIRTVPPYPYRPVDRRPTNYPTNGHEGGQGTNIHTDSGAGTRSGFDEAFYPQKPRVPPVEIDLSKLMPEEEMHKPVDTSNQVNGFHRRPNPVPTAAVQRPTQSPSLVREDHRRRPTHREGSEAHGTDIPNRRNHYTGGHQPYQPRRGPHTGRQHSSQTGSTGTGVVSYDRQPNGQDRIRQRPQPTRHEEEDQSSEVRTGHHTGDDDRSPSRWPETPRYDHGARTDQWSGRGHHVPPTRRGHGSYQPIDGNGSYDYAAGRDRTHSQGKPEVGDRHRSLPPDTRTGTQTFDSSVDSTDDTDYSGEGLPGISHRGDCPSVSQCRCCRWSTQQTRKSMECIQPKFKTVEVQVCTEEYNGVCVRTGRRKTLKPNGTEVRMCSKVQLKRSCFVCCPTFYPRGHNQTCNGVLDGIDKKGLRISVEADIGGFYQPPRVSQNTVRPQDGRHERPRDQAVQRSGPSSRLNGHAAYRAPSSIMAGSERRMMADQTPNTRRICIIKTMGPNGEVHSERRPCSTTEGVTEVVEREKENTTAACCMTREQLHNLFLRYCCGTKRYHGREYDQRMCCGTRETTTTRQIRQRAEPIARTPELDTRQPQLINGGDTGRARTVVDTEPLRAERISPPDTEPQISMESVLTEKEDLEDAYRESIDSIPESRTPVDTVRRRKCCPPGTRLRTISNGEESIETQGSPDTSSRGNGRIRNGYVMWSRVYSCCSNGNYLRKVACCLQKTSVSKLCCRKVSNLRS